MRIEKPKRWHTSTIKGITYEIAPDGTRYNGTAAEVNAARLLPASRNSLAEDIRQHRRNRAIYGTHDEYIWQVKRSRRDAIRREATNVRYFDTTPNGITGLTTADEIALAAAARAAGIDTADFIAAAVRAAIAATGPIAYTRHERAALAAVRAA